MSPQETNTIEYTSVESRWFFIKPVPLAISEFFAGVNAESRTDVYFMEKLRDDPPYLDVGIKLREGGYEVKTLQEEFHGSSIPGKVQRWKKTRRQIPQGIELNKSWMEVSKKRKMISYKVRSGDIYGPVSYFPDEGCNVELTTFGTPFENHWTFGLESFGNDQVLIDNLRITYDRISLQIEGLPRILHENYSKSYPEWLAEL